MLNVRDHAHKYKYTAHHKSVFRGIDPKAKFSLKDYEVGSIGQWPCFSSCTKNERNARRFSK